MKRPKITVYITNYNYGKYITKAIKSVLNQTFKDIEILIIDDGSTDGSKKIINKFTKKYSFILAKFNKNQGLIKSCNAALKLASGKYILRLDADDWLDKNAIEIMYNKLEKNKKIEFIFPDYYEVDENGIILHSIRRHDFENVKLYDSPAHGACGLFRRKTLIETGGYDENFSCQDGVEIWLRFYKKFKVMNINIPLFYYRRHGNNLTENKGKILQNRNKILIKHNNKKKEIIAFIPIRGPKFDKFSNVFRKLGHKTLLDWTLENLKKIDSIKYIIVSSPDNSVLNYIKKIKNPKIIAMKRSLSLSSQSVIIDDSIKFALKKIKQQKKINPSYVILSKLNCPFRNYKHIENASNTIQIYNLDRVYGVVTENNASFRHNGNSLEPIRSYDYATINSIDKKKINIRIENEEIYNESGNFIIYSVKSIINKKTKKKLKIGHELLGKLSSYEIRSEFDWILAEKIASNYEKFNQH